MKILRAKHHPSKIKFKVELFDPKEIRFLPSITWLRKRMATFGYEESFEKHGMQYPIAVSAADHDWVRRRINIEPNNPQKTNYDKRGAVIPGLYVHVGHKRVLWALENNYDMIEGYFIKSTTDRQLVKRFTNIPHERIPK